MGKNHKTVLIVEDSPVQSAALALLLEREGLQVLCAFSGELGVSMAHQYAPDVIVLDIEMSEMSGFEACQRLKKNARTAGIPVVMLTVHNEFTTLARGLDLGAVDFIPKDDFSYEMLLEALRQLHVLE
jgi:CheY-like chemotaxis protein